MSCFEGQQPLLLSEVSLGVDSLTLLLVSVVCEPDNVLITSRWCLATRKSSSQVCLSPPSVQDPSDRVLDICRISAPSARVLLLLNAHLPSIQLKSCIPPRASSCMNNLICSKCSCRTSAEPFRWVCCLCNPLRFILSFFLALQGEAGQGWLCEVLLIGKCFLYRLVFSYCQDVMCCW